MHIALHPERIAVAWPNHRGVVAWAITKPAKLGQGAGHVVMPEGLSLRIVDSQPNRHDGGQNRKAESHLSSSVKADGGSIFHCIELEGVRAVGNLAGVV
jgi:hypothetical protein